MKYINFKRYKFSTITKNISTLISRYLRVFRILDFDRYYFKRIFKYLDIRRFKFEKVTKYLDIRRFKFEKVTKYLNIKTYKIDRIGKIDFFSSKFLLLHFPIAIIFFGFLYVFIPTFYNYEKSDIEKIICKSKNIECAIKGKINYSFYPTPRLKIKKIIINDFVERKKTLITVESAAINLSIKNLLAKDKHAYKKIKLNNFQINFDLKKIKKYSDVFFKKIDLIPIVFSKGEIIISDGSDYVTTIKNTNFNLEFKPNLIDGELKGVFLEDEIYINLNSKILDNKITTDLIFKMLNMNFLTKTNFTHSIKKKNITNGNFLIKKDKNRITGLFNYKDNQLILNKSKLKNTFLDGNLEGEIAFLPYFNFNLNLDLNSLNFTKLYNYFLSLDKKEQKNLFKINKKINGDLNLSTNKIYSGYNLVKSFESRLKFSNGIISIEQFLINLGKLGAADLLGEINQDKKFTNFKFESNIFVDNKKKFLSKFGVYSKKNISPSFFIAANLDLDNLKVTFYEISNKEKLKKEDVDYIENEFNEIMLEKGYETLLNFPKFKNFIKLILSETN